MNHGVLRYCVHGREMSTNSSSSSRTSSSDSVPDHRRRSSSRYEDLRQTSQILDEQVDRQTWSEFLRDGDENMASRSESSYDRKRRLTGYSEDGRRGRGIGALSSSNSGVLNETTARLPPTPPRPVFPTRHESSSSQPSFYDLTSPSPPPRPPQLTRPNMEARHNDPAGSPTDYAVPKWQSDSEVTHCPICKSQFTFWFRKHHCRKCGRVVCAACSPHRITIPRQFIVRPPENKRSSIFQSETIDLMEEDSDSSTEQANMSTGRARNPALGGGEEVRLCRPCVPDPQPAPSGNSLFAPGLGRVHHYTNGIPLDQDRNPVPGAPRSTASAERFGRRPWGLDWQRNRDPISSPNSRRYSGSLLQSHETSVGDVRSDEGQRQRDFRRQRGRGMIVRAELPDLLLTMS